MKNQTRTRRMLPLAVALSAAAMLAAAGIAAIPDGGGVIRGCYNTKLANALRVIDSAAGQKCKLDLGEKALDWNQTGPQGLQGPQGAKGEPGPQGPAGPPGLSVDAFAQERADVQTDIPDTARELSVIGVPAGAYVITATGHVGNFGTEPALVACILETGPTTFDFARESLNPSEFDSIAMSAAVVKDQEGRIAVQCADAGADTRIENLRLTAVRVATLTVRP